MKKERKRWREERKGEKLIKDRKREENGGKWGERERDGEDEKGNNE